MKKSQPAHVSKTNVKRVQPNKPVKETREIERLMLLMTHQKGKTIQFEISAKEGSKVYVAGTFNNWDPTTHPLEHHPEDGVFRGTINLPVGKHEYKFVVNGVWHLDAKCPNWTHNEHGSLNSVIHV
jgi:1,4-alpha-glucan branching enzyme